MCQKTVSSGIYLQQSHELILPFPAQPLPAVSPPAEASQEAAAFKKRTYDHQQKPECPRCGLTAPDDRLPGSRLSVHSGSRSSKRRKETGAAAGSHQTAATPAGKFYSMT